MNTPYPCDRCKHLGYDIMTRNEPSDTTFYNVGYTTGIKSCPKFECYRDTRLTQGESDFLFVTEDYYQTAKMVKARTRLPSDVCLTIVRNHRF